MTWFENKKALENTQIQQKTTNHWNWSTCFDFILLYKYFIFHIVGAFCFAYFVLVLSVVIAVI